MKRDIKELLEILISSLEDGPKKHYCNRGICGEIWDLTSNSMLNVAEGYLLQNYIKSKQPSRASCSKFFWPHCEGTSYWWPTMLNGIRYREIRIEYLKFLLEEIENG